MSARIVAIDANAAEFDDEAEDWHGEAYDLFDKARIHLYRYQEPVLGVVEEDDYLVAALAAGPPYGDPHMGMSFSAVVDPEHRRKGLARALIEDFVEYCTSQGFPVEAQVVNEGAMVPLLSELGFTPEGDDSPMWSNPRKGRTIKQRIREAEKLGVGLYSLMYERGDERVDVYLMLDEDADVVGMLEISSGREESKHIVNDDFERVTARCWDAMMVEASAIDPDYKGRGLGALLYLWAMTEQEAIYPDRMSVSPSAGRVWERLQSSDEVLWHEFDNVYSPRTAIPEDDCVIYEDDDEYIDGAFELKYAEAVKLKKLLEPLISRGENYFEASGLSVDDLNQEASRLFDRAY